LEHKRDFGNVPRDKGDAYTDSKRLRELETIRNQKKKNKNGKNNKY